MSPFLRAGLALITLALTFSLVHGGEIPTTERRMQPTLKISGTFQTDGFRVSTVDPDGPGAHMDLVGAANPVRGILDPGDVITAIDGKSFRDDLEFYDLLYRAHNNGGGRLTLSVLDVKTGQVARWRVAPVLVMRDVPVRAGSAGLGLKKLPPALPNLNPLPDDLR
jgi:hypothetical protein